jgi:hypothetical protein
VRRLVPRIGEEYRRLVRQLTDTINETDPARDRDVIRELVGEVGVEVDEREIRLISRHADIEKALARARGSALSNKFGSGALLPRLSVRGGFALIVAPHLLHTPLKFRE